jgi:hypothetical protein
VNYQSALNIEEKDWTFTTLSTSPKKMIDFIFYANSHYGGGDVTMNKFDTTSMCQSNEKEKKRFIRCLEGFVVPNNEPTKASPVIPSDHRAIVATFELKGNDECL